LLRALSAVCFTGCDVAFCDGDRGRHDYGIRREELQLGETGEEFFALNNPICSEADLLAISGLANRVKNEDFLGSAYLFLWFLLSKVIAVDVNPSSERRLVGPFLSGPDHQAGGLACRLSNSVEPEW